MAIKIVNGQIPNFDKGTLERADILIEAGKIVKVGSFEGDTDEMIDAKGRIVSPGFIDIHMHEETFDAVSGVPYFASVYELMMGSTTCVAGNCGNNRQSIHSFVEHVKEHGAPVNYMTFLGHNYLRRSVGIEDRYRAATTTEIEKMKALIEACIPYGIVGLSYGIEYSPGVDFDEMAELAKGFPNKSYLLSAHFRQDADGAVDSIEELVRLSRVTGQPMQISHIGSCSAYGHMKRSLELMAEARAEGLDILADCYPYDAFATTIGSAVFDEGCFEQWQKGYKAILLTESPYANQFCTKELFESVKQTHPDMIVAAFVMNEHEVIEALKDPNVLVGSDSLYKLNQGHPRGAGTFPRVLGRYVRELGAIPLMDALRRMTVAPAKRLNLQFKGEIKAGYDADLVIFDPENITDLADFEHPTSPPAGIDYVIINGEVAVEKGTLKRKNLGTYIPFETSEERVSESILD